MQMSMGFGFHQSQEFSQRQQLECTICKQSCDSHSSLCPCARIEDLMKRNVKLNCPACHAKQEVGLNKDDFYECRKCSQQFSAGPACGYDAATLKRGYILTFDEAIDIVWLPEKGKGIFPIDDRLRFYGEVQKIARKRCRGKKSIDLNALWAEQETLRLAMCNPSDIMTADEKGPGHDGSLAKDTSSDLMD